MEKYGILLLIFVYIYRLIGGIAYHSLSLQEIGQMLYRKYQKS
jgi:hypothetical protein